MSAPTGCGCILHSLSEQRPLVRITGERCLTCELVEAHEHRSEYELILTSTKDDLGMLVAKDNTEVEAMTYGRLH